MENKVRRFRSSTSNKIRKKFDSQKKGILNDYEIFRMAYYLHKSVPLDKELVILCIGTEKIPGDTIGPSTGHLIRRATDSITVYGTAYNPVDAKNLNQYNELIKKKHKKDFVLAIDASISEVLKPGEVIIKREPIKPAVLNPHCKDAPLVGDISIMAIVGKSNKTAYSIEADDPILDSLTKFLSSSVILYNTFFRKKRLVNMDFA